MSETARPSSARLRAPRAAAIAGIVFSALLIASIVLVRISVPVDLGDSGAWLASSSSGKVALAMNLVPFAGVAFLWFVGVLRDRLGANEDQLFATVFLGSGLLFLAMLFMAAALIGSILLVHEANPNRAQAAEIFTFARVAAYEILNIYAIKMAGVFMVVTSTLGLRTRFIPRWLAFFGLAVAATLLLASRSSDWMVLVFPLWVLLLSLYILVDNLGLAAHQGRAGATSLGLHSERSAMGSLNVGNLDRVLRIVVGCALVGLAAAGSIGAWGYLGFVPLVTGLAARCPLYSILGIRTTSR